MDCNVVQDAQKVFVSLPTPTSSRIRHPSAHGDVGWTEAVPLGASLGKTLGL